jgi:hypothetical protein
MRFLLRLATKASWPGGEPNLDRAIGEFRLREGESGISVWAYQSDEELHLIVAAISCARLAKGDRIDKVDFLPIPNDLAEKFGAVTSTPGVTPVARANLLHRELVWPQDALDKLARALFDAGCSVTRVPKSEARARVLELTSQDVADAPAREAIELERARARDKR